LNREAIKNVAKPQTIEPHKSDQRLRRDERGYFAEADAAEIMLPSSILI
jgi:hypothetical protein